jgi:hypothetical protein
MRPEEIAQLRIRLQQEQEDEARERAWEEAQARAQLLRDRLVNDALEVRWNAYYQRVQTGLGPRLDDPDNLQAAVNIAQGRVTFLISMQQEGAPVGLDEDDWQNRLQDMMWDANLRLDRELRRMEAVEPGIEAQDAPRRVELVVPRAEARDEDDRARQDLDAQERNEAWARELDEQWAQDDEDAWQQEQFYRVQMRQIEQAEREAQQEAVNGDRAGQGADQQAMGDGEDDAQ